MNERMKELTIMKTTNIKVMGYRLWVIAMMLMCAMSAWAISYPTYSNSSMVGGRTVYQSAASHQGTVYQTMEQRNTSSFCSGDLSTEDMKQTRYSDSGFGSISTVPTIGEDGMAENGEHRGPAVRRGGPGTPGGDLHEDEQQPIGDAVWPLLLLALAYMGMRTRRRVVNNKE